MEQIQRRSHFLKLYRQQLRRELHEMGYGQPKFKSETVHPK